MIRHLNILLPKKLTFTPRSWTEIECYTILSIILCNFNVLKFYLVITNILFFFIELSGPALSLSTVLNTKNH